jgi:hypothetical protein
VLFLFDIVTAAAIGNTRCVSHHFRWGRDMTMSQVGSVASFQVQHHLSAPRGSLINVPVQPGLDTALLNRGYSWHRGALREIRECELALWAGVRVDRLQVRSNIPSDLYDRLDSERLSLLAAA